MPDTPIITLTTDFGVSSPYVGAMKGAILAINPRATLVDISHTVPAQDVRSGAIVLADITPLFPDETIHVAVIDPGVGTDRAMVYAQLGGQRYVCPDNGLLSRLAIDATPSTLIAITEARWFRQPVSRTFHGRDVMGPVAAHLSLGLDPAELGRPHPSLHQLDWPGAARVADSKGGVRRLEGVIESVDSFGNLITNITRDALADAPSDESVSVTCDGHETHGIFQTYGDQPPLTLIALIGSTDRLELAIVDENAALMLGIAVGTPVVVTW